MTVADQDDAVRLLSAPKPKLVPTRRFVMWATIVVTTIAVVVVGEMYMFPLRYVPYATEATCIVQGVVPFWTPQQQQQQFLGEMNCTSRIVYTPLVSYHKSGDVVKLQTCDDAIHYYMDSDLDQKCKSFVFHVLLVVLPCAAPIGWLLLSQFERDVGMHEQKFWEVVYA